MVVYSKSFFSVTALLVVEITYKLILLSWLLSFERLCYWGWAMAHSKALEKTARG